MKTLFRRLCKQVYHTTPPSLFVNWKFRFIVPANVMQNGRDALVASAYGTWNTGGIPFSATRRGRSMGHGRDKRDPPAQPSRRRQREGRACRVRLRNVEHRGHSIQRHAQRSRQARPSRATIPEKTTGGTRLSRPPTERRTQGAFHSAPRATVATSATLPRADAVRWGTIATSATLPRDHPGEDDGRDALVASAYGTWRPPAQPAWGNLTRPA